MFYKYASRLMQCGIGWSQPLYTRWYLDQPSRFVTKHAVLCNSARTTWIDISRIFRVVLFWKFCRFWHYFL